MFLQGDDREVPDPADGAGQLKAHEGPRAPGTN